MTDQKQPASPSQGGSKKRLDVAIIRQMVTLTTSGFGLVAALAWNNVIQEFVNTEIKPYLPSGSGVLSLLIYAILVTVLAVTVTYQLSQLTERIDRQPR